MAKYVCNGALVTCSFSIIPFVPMLPMAPLTVLPDNRILLHGQPMASCMDYASMVNILPIAMCCSPDNEAVQAAFGSPVPCTPLVLSPWKSPKSNVMLAGENALLDNCTCDCELGGGIISIINPGQATTMER